MSENKKNIKIYSTVVLVGAMIFCMCQNLTGSVLNEIITDYEMSLDIGGLMSFLQFLGGIIVIFVLLKVSDRMKKPVLLMAGFALAGIMLIFIGGFPQFPLFIALYLIFGAALGTIDTLNNAVLSDVNPDNINGILSILHGMCGLGAAIIPIVTVILGTSNWKGTYRIVGIVALIIAVMQLGMYSKGKKGIDSFSSNTSKTSVKESSKGFFADKDIWFAAVSVLFFGLSQGGITAWVVKFSRETFPDAGAFMWALCLSMYWLGTTVCRLAMGVNGSLKRLNSRRVIIIGGILAGVALMLGMIPGNYICFVAGVFMYGVLSGASIPQTVALMTKWYPKNSGLCSSLSFISFYIGLAAAGLTMGILASAFGMRMMMVLPVVAVILSGVAAIPISKNR